MEGDDRPHARVWPLSAASGRLDPAEAVTEQIDLPTPPADCQPPQGMALYGRYLYQMVGTAYDHEGCPGSVREEGGNTHLYCVDVNTGEVVQKAHTRAFHQLDFREPEGMAVWPVEHGHEQAARLCFGFASGPSGERLASIAFKEKTS